MSILDQRVKDVIAAIRVDDDVDIQALLEEERTGKKRKTLVKWLEKQGAQGSGPVVTESENVDASAPLEPIYEEKPPEKPNLFLASVAWIDSVGGGAIPINELISTLCQKRDSWQRSTSCGVENIIVNMPEEGLTILVR